MSDTTTSETLGRYNPHHWLCPTHNIWYYDGLPIEPHAECRLEVFSYDGKTSNHFWGKWVITAKAADDE